jgi:uncharacterized protein (TIGR02271 family)
MTIRTITAIYDSESEARQARAQLVDNGVDDDDVRIVSHNLSSTPVSGDADKGLWESIKDFFIGDADRPTYSEGLRRGGYLLTARVDDDHSAQAISLLEHTNAVDLDQRAEQWRAEGWTEEDDSYIARKQTSQMESAEMSPSDTAPPNTLRSDDLTARDERAIPVVEERLRVGKREVDRGGVRVRSYVVEEPVHEEVSLREERVEIERRPAAGRGAAAADDPELFREQTIEVSERGEEAVVAKDAVVTEEVVVRKSADERTENIDETVRRTEVDVDDTRTRPGSPAASKRPQPRGRPRST